MGTLGLALLLAKWNATGSFAAAGASAGGFALTAGILAPVRGRLVDRVGRRTGLRALGVADSLTGLVLVGFTATSQGPLPVMVAATVLGALAPPVSASMRTIWPELVGSGPLLQSALAFDTVVEEVLYVTGPMLAGLLVSLTDPHFALGTSVVLQLAAVLMFSGWLPDAGGSEQYRSRLHLSRVKTEEKPFLLSVLPPTLIPLLASGIALGVINVAVPALALDEGSAASAGWLLAVLSAGSVLGGLVYGHRNWRSPVAARYKMLCLASVLCVAPLPLATGVFSIAPFLLLAGLPITPLLATAYLLADRWTPSGRKTEAAAWISTANNSGVAAGSALAGALVDKGSLGMILSIPAIATLCGLVAAVALTKNRSESRARSADDTSP